MAIDFGIDKSEFLNRIYEKDIYIARGAISGNLPSWAEINDMIYATDPRPPYMGLHKNGFLAESEYTETYTEIGLVKKRIKKHDFYRHMREGATLVLNRFESRSAYIKRICVEISRLVNAQSVANGYLAFGGKGSFGCHWDTHDVFAVQLIGKKRWQVFRPSFELPLPMHKSKDHLADCPETPVFDEVLEAGDILYVPRGWWHNAIPVEGEETFHIAVGIHPPVIVDYTRWVLGNVLPSFLEYRQSLFIDGGNEEKITAAAKIIGAELAKPEYVERFLREVVMLERADTGFAFDRYVSPTNEEISEEALVQVSCGMMVFDEGNCVIAGGRKIKLETPLYNILRLISEKGGLVNIPALRESIQSETTTAGQSVEQLIRRLALHDLVEVLA